MFVTFVIFPGVTESTSISFITSPAWFDLFIVTVFNTFDTIGRLLGGFPSLMIPLKRKGLIHFVGFARLLGVGVAIYIMVA